MLFRRGIKIYTVHLPPGAVATSENAVFLREGFNWVAFFFTGFWALYNRLWAHGVLLILFNILLFTMREAGTLPMVTLSIIQVGVQVVVGFQANDWLRAGLAKRNYILADITASDSDLRAEQRYFERVLKSF